LIIIVISIDTELNFERTFIDESRNICEDRSCLFKDVLKRMLFKRL
jgi:hypothetical protein